MNCQTTCLDVALDLHARGLPITICRDKAPIGNEWQLKKWADVEIADTFARHPRFNVGLQWGPRSDMIDIEADNPEEEAAFSRLFADCEIPVAPTYISKRGKHRLFKWHPELAKLNAGVVYFEKLGIRIGAGDKGAHSLVPPSQTDGTARKWLVSLDDADPPPLPDMVVQRILAAAGFSNGSNGKTNKSADAWENITGGVGNGERNNSAASYIGKLLSGQTYLDDTSVAILRDTVHAWNERNNPPLPRDEIDKTFDSILAREKQKRQDKEPTEAKPLARYTAAELANGNFELEYLVRGILVDLQPMVFGGPHKSLKTSLLMDLAISLATAGHFLGYFKVERAARVGIISGESGLFTLRETALRIAAASGRNLADLQSSLIVSDTIPRIDSAVHRDAVREFIAADSIEVAIFDPAYLMFGASGDRASNVFQMGEVLRPLAEMCQEIGCTPIIAHHSKKGRIEGRYDPLELEELAFSGWCEFARQWLLVSRREPYEEGTGHHKLWLRSGGSAGHSGLWGLDIDEGPNSAAEGREWGVQIIKGSEIRQGKADAKENAKEKAKAEKLERDKIAVVRVLLKTPTGDSKSGIRDRTGINAGLGVVLESLLEDGTIEECEIVRVNRKTPYQGYKITQSEGEI